MSSSLSALEGDRESPNGFAPKTWLSRLPPSELQLVRLDENPEWPGDLIGESSSRSLWVLDFEGGRRSSADSCGPFNGDWVRNEGAVGL